MKVSKTARGLVNTDKIAVLVSHARIYKRAMKEKQKVRHTSIQFNYSFDSDSGPVNPANLLRPKRPCRTGASMLCLWWRWLRRSSHHNGEVGGGKIKNTARTVARAGD